MGIAMTWYRCDIRRASSNHWDTYVRELDLPGTGTTKATAKENTVALIVTTTGDLNPHIVWVES